MSPITLFTIRKCNLLHFLQRVDKQKRFLIPFTGLIMLKETKDFFKFDTKPAALA